jgi:acyl carrier protein
MNSIDEFVTVVQDELGLAVTSEDVTVPLDRVGGWDSVHLLTLATVLEQRTGRSLALPDILEADTLERIYLLAVRA